MAEPIADGGREAGICGHDGTDWLKVKTDDEGKLLVEVDPSALPEGAATAANQVTMITALQLIDDLRNALDSVGTDELDVNVEASVLPTDAATETTVAEVSARLGDETSPAAGTTNKLLTDCLTALQLIDDLRGALDSVDTDELVVNVDESALPTGAATSANQSTAITALQSIQNLVGALHDVGLDELDVNLVGNDVDAGVRHGSMSQDTYNGVPGDTNLHELTSVSGPGILIGLDLVSDHASSRVQVVVDGLAIHGPDAAAPGTVTAWLLSDLHDSGDESTWCKTGVYDDVNDYYSLFLKRGVVYNSTLVVNYRAGSATADVGVAVQYRGLT